VEFEQVSPGRSGVAVGVSDPIAARAGEPASASAAMPAKAVFRSNDFLIMVKWTCHVM
jgi:hypothetical protein